MLTAVLLMCDTVIINYAIEIMQSAFVWVLHIQNLLLNPRLNTPKYIVICIVTAQQPYRLPDIIKRRKGKYDTEK